jgi:RimJ/RimL family protein N-acetyltransferase
MVAGEMSSLRIETKRLVLEGLVPEDAPALNAIRNDPVTRRYLAPKPPETLEATLELIDTIAADNAGGAACNLAIRLRNGALIGLVGVWKIDVERQVGELGYLVAREHCNRGYATEALGALFTHVDKRSLTLDAMVHLDNVASIRLLDRFGFSRIPPTGDEDPGCVYYRRRAPVHAPRDARYCRGCDVRS